MEVAGGVIAVVSLGIQLAESVQKIRKVLRGVKEAPEELQRLMRKIDLLHEIFKYVNALIEQQRHILVHHGMIPLFEGTLHTCARSVNRLEGEIAHVQGSSDDRRKALGVRQMKSMRKHQALRAVLRKETLEDLCSAVDESVRELSLILQLNSTQLLLGNLPILRTLDSHEHTIQTLRKGSTADPSTSADEQQTLVVQTQKTQASNELSISGNRSTRSKYTRRSYCQKLWGYVQFREEVECTRREAEDQEQITMQRWSTVFTLPFVRIFLEWQLLRSYGQVSRSLRYYPRIADPLLYLASFRGFDGEDPLRDALARREISPFAVDDDGWTLLHYAAFHGNPDLCSMLIRLGVNPQQTDFYGFSAVVYSSQIWTSETIRVLVNAQENYVTADVQELYRSYYGSAEGAELVFSYDMSSSELSDHSNFLITPLHVALLHLGGGNNSIRFEPDDWLSLVRKLLRGTVSLHAQCEGSFSNPLWNNRTTELLTPLQCLLLVSDHPFDGERAAKTWLALLHEAEYDRVAYLIQEMLLHAQYELKDFEMGHQIPARTRCFGLLDKPAKIMLIRLDPPKVWWDWHIRPACKAYDVLHEFRNFNIHHDTSSPDYTIQDGRVVTIAQWTQSWPFCHPYWAEEYWPYFYQDDQQMNAWEQRCKKARNRHARRAEKPSRKLTRSQRRRTLTLPGAWIE